MRSLDQYRVLVLEDDRFQLEAVALALRNMGVQHVDKAANGHDALAFIESGDQVYDVVLCDLQNNDALDMDGVEFIRSAGRGRIGSLVLLSGLDEDLLASSALLASRCHIPFVACLRKPLNFASLRAVLDRCPPHHQYVEQPREAIGTRAWAKSDLRSAIVKGEIVPYFHPKLCLRTGTLSGVEVLARWQHPELGMLSPAAFVPLIEQKQLMHAMTESLYRQTLSVMQEWASRGVALSVALNASPLTLQDVSVPNRWRSLVDGAGMDPAAITVEITETAAAKDLSGLLETVTRLRMHGFAVSLDDFGTSFSSLQQLIELPINELKIDRSFVIQAPYSSKAMLVFDMIISIAQSMNLKTVAEGIESEEVADMMRRSGCDVGQGYFFARPMSAADLWTWHQNNHAACTH
jgi:EAL domain-containing protein (putative c-di-GMP-specific phosphodiesterase class I)